MNSKDIDCSVYTIEPSGTNDFGPCKCCGNKSRNVWGFVYRDGDARAVYYVQWTIGAIQKHGAHFDLIMGRFGRGTQASDRRAVCLEYRITASGQSFMVIDASTRPVAASSLVGKALGRTDVIGTQLKQEVFDIVDAIWIQDPRIKEITERSSTG